MHVLINNKKNERISRHFMSEEFACKCGRPICNVSFVSEILLQLLERVRLHFNAPIRINSGYRCIEHNQMIGGSKNSRHTHGTAADIVVDGVNPLDVHAYLDNNHKNSLGLGKYASFTHVDVREEKARWGSNV